MQEACGRASTTFPVALTPIFSKCFEKLIRDYICFVLPASLDPLQFAYCSNRFTDDANAFTLHTALYHLENKTTYVRMLFVDYSSAFNTIVLATLVAKLQTLGTEQISLQLDPGLPDRQKSGGQNGQHHLISPGPQHWCSAGLSPQPTPVLPVHTWMYSHTAPTSLSNLLMTQRWKAWSLTMMRWPRERRWVPWLNGVRRTTSHSTLTRPRSWWWISGDRAENTHPSPSIRLLWSG